MMQPDVSVVVVIDYKASGTGDGTDLRAVLRALAGQQFDGEVEIILAETETAARDLPPNLEREHAGLRILAVPAETSYDLKNAGVLAARADLALVLDADCVPAPGWIAAAVAHHRAHPRAAVISGKTLYHAQGLLPRILALLDRSYVDPGRAGRTTAISNNNAAFLREAMRRHPLGNELGTFGSKTQSVQMIAAGEELRFEPDMVAFHRYTGWNMARVDRRHIGFAMAKQRLLGADDVSHAWMFRLGVAGLPFILAMALAGSWKRCLTRASSYGIAWWQVPAAVAVAVPVHLFEVPGILRALRGGKMAYGEGYV